MKGIVAVECNAAGKSERNPLPKETGDISLLIILR